MNISNSNKSLFGLLCGILIGILIGVGLIKLFLVFQHKNEEIAMLKEELSQFQTDRIKDILRFGQWKLQVEELAERYGWQLPEMSDSLTFVVDGPSFEEHITAEKVGDSSRVMEKSVKMDSVCQTE